MRFVTARFLTVVAMIALDACHDASTAPNATARSSATSEEQRADDAPLVRITSPGSAAVVAAGIGQPGAGSLIGGSAFAITIETITSSRSVPARLSTDIRNTTLLGQPNPNFPGLNIHVDADLITPDGKVIPAHTNLASLFNILGADESSGPSVTIWAGWHVLESLPANVKHLTITAEVRDAEGRIGRDVVRVQVDQHPRAPGQALTPAPAPVTLGGPDAPDGPLVELIGPRDGSSIAIGTPTASALTFFQVSALDRSGAGIGVSENGGADPKQPIGLIRDRTQIAIRGPNRNVPGFEFTFDVALRQPNGNIVPAGRNLAPLFDIAGSEHDTRGDESFDDGAKERDDASDGSRVRTTLDWVVGGALVLPAGKHTVTVTARVTDSVGKTGSATRVFGVSTAPDGQSLTPLP
ncbi:MAG: hypothetical protein NVS4B3_23780 [Gemmatimonadaceae bacterium]